MIKTIKFENEKQQTKMFVSVGSSRICFNIDSRDYAQVLNNNIEPIKMGKIYLNRPRPPVFV